MLFTLAAAWAGSEVLVTAEAECAPTVESVRVELASGKSYTWLVDPGTPVVQIGESWIGQVEIPDAVRAKLACDGRVLVLAGAESLGGDLVGSAVQVDKAAGTMRVAVSGEKTVTLTQTGGTGFVPKPAPAPETPPPAQVVYPTGTVLTKQGVMLELRDPIANELEFEVDIRLSTSSTGYAVLDMEAIKLTTPKGDLPPDRPKLVIIPPGKTKNTTLTWSGDHRHRELRLALDQGVRSVDVTGPPLEAGRSGIEGGVASAGGAACTVDKAKVGKTVRADITCQSEVPMVLDTREIAVVAGDSRSTNIHDRAGVVLIWPGEKLSVVLYVEDVPSGALELDWSQVFRMTNPLAVPYGTAPLKGAW